jgi:hypothetical protein
LIGLIDGMGVVGEYRSENEALDTAYHIDKTSDKLLASKRSLNLHLK